MDFNDHYRTLNTASIRLILHRTNQTTLLVLRNCLGNKFSIAMPNEVCKLDFEIFAISSDCNFWKKFTVRIFKMQFYIHSFSKPKI